MSDSEKPTNRSGRKPPLTIHPISITGEFRAKETRAEMLSRLSIEEADAEHIRAQADRKAALEDWRERLLLKSGLTILIVVGAYCLGLNALPGKSTERRGLCGLCPGDGKEIRTGANNFLIFASSGFCRSRGLGLAPAFPQATFKSPGLDPAYSSDPHVA